MSTASSVSSSSSSLSSTSKSPKRNLSNTVIGKKILFESNLQKSTLEKTSASKSIQTTPTLGRVQNGHEWPPSSVANDSTQRAESKYFRNIVGNTADKTKMLSQHNDLNVQINRTSPIKSVKLLNNLNALKLK